MSGFNKPVAAPLLEEPVELEAELEPELELFTPLELDAPELLELAAVVEPPWLLEGLPEELELAPWLLLEVLPLLAMLPVLVPVLVPDDATPLVQAAPSRAPIRTPAILMRPPCAPRHCFGTDCSTQGRASPAALPPARPARVSWEGTRGGRLSMVRSAMLSRLALVALLVSGRARAAEPDIAWDPGLAFDFDREQYKVLLQQIVAQGYHEASAFVGLSRGKPLRIFVYTHEHYEAEFGTAAEISHGAHYFRDAIYVNGGSRLDAHFAGTLAHEMTHAVLDYRGTGHALPVWLNEGLAERVSWRHQGLDELANSQAMTIKEAGEHGTLTPLQGHDYLSPFGYLQSWAAVLFIEKKLGRNVLLAIVKKTLDGLPFERALYQETRWSQRELEQAFGEWADQLLR